MGVVDLIWDLGQDGQIRDLEGEVKQLKENQLILKQWIEYLNVEIEKLKAQNENP